MTGKARSGGVALICVVGLGLAGMVPRSATADARDHRARGTPRAGRVAPDRKPPPAPPDEPWARVPKILQRISAPTFPARTCDVTAHGAVGDGRTDARAAFTRAISACHLAGGGRVVVPAGNFLLLGPIQLKSNINLHVTRDAVVRFSNSPAHYLPPVLVRWEGTRCYNYSPLIYALRERNIAITGAGRIDGQATAPGSGWEQLVRTPGDPGKQREDLRSMGRTRVPLEKRVFGQGSNLRPPLFQAYESQNILIEGVTFTGSPFWTLTPAYSRNITVRNVTVIGDRKRTLHNDDGFNPDSSQDVLVENNTFDTVCDNIGIKAGRDNDAWGDQSAENIVIRNNLFRHAWSGVSVGSEVSGGVRNVFIEHNQVHQARFALHVKSNGFRGGAVQGIYSRNNHIRSVEECIRIETAYGEVSRTDHATPLRDLWFEDLRCEKASVVAIRSEGPSGLPISDLVFRNVTVDSARQALHISDTRGYLFDNVRINGVRMPPGIQVAGPLGTRAAR